MQENNNFNKSYETFLETFQEQNQRMAASFFEGMQDRLPFSPTLIGDIFIKTAQSLLHNPSSLLNAQEQLLEEVRELWQKMLSPEKSAAFKTTVDKRFRHDAWETVPYFLFMKEYYLITSRWLQNLVSQTEGLDAETHHKILFYMKQLVYQR